MEQCPAPALPGAAPIPHDSSSAGQRLNAGFSAFICRSAGFDRHALELACGDWGQWHHYRHQSRRCDSDSCDDCDTRDWNTRTLSQERRVTKPGFAISVLIFLAERYAPSRARRALRLQRYVAASRVEDWVQFSIYRG